MILSTANSSIYSEILAIIGITASILFLIFQYRNNYEEFKTIVKKFSILTLKSTFAYGVIFSMYLVNRKMQSGITDNSDAFFLISQKINIFSTLFFAMANVICFCIFGTFAIFLIVLIIIKISGKNQLKQNGNRELR